MGLYKTKEKDETIQLFKTGNYSQKQIAKKLNVRTGTVSTWIKNYKKSKTPYASEIALIKTKLNSELQSNNPCPKNIYCLVNSIKILSTLSSTPKP